MAKDFFNMDMAQFIDQRMEWKRFFHFHKGPDVNLEEEIETYRMILRTAADVCEDIETGARDHWHEEVSLVDGQVITPPHINAGYDKLK